MEIDSTFFKVSALPPAKAVESIDGVLQNIFQTMNLPTLKTCREMCSRWHTLVTHELRQQITIKLCFDGPDRDMELKNCAQGVVNLSAAGTSCVNPEEKLIVLRKTENPFSPKPSLFTLPNLIKVIQKNPQSFPCVSYEIITKLLGSEEIKQFLQCVGSTVRRLKLELHYLLNYYNSFEVSNITRDLRNLLIFQTPYLHHFHLIAHLPEYLGPDIINYSYDNSTDNFLHQKCVTVGQRQRSKRLLNTLKSFTYEGLLPPYVFSNIIEAAVNLRKVECVESGKDFLKRVGTSTLPINPHFTHLLERLSGRYTGKICTLNRIGIGWYFQERHKYLPYVHLFNDIMESHSETLTELVFYSANFCPELKIPPIANLKTLRFKLDQWEGIRLTVNTSVKIDEDIACKLAAKFPKLECLTFSKKFNFADHFALRLGVDPSGPFSSVETIRPNIFCSWDAIETICTKMSDLFIRAKVHLTSSRRLVPEFGLKNIPLQDPR